MVILSDTSSSDDSEQLGWWTEAAGRSSLGTELCECLH